MFVLNETKNVGFEWHKRTKNALTRYLFFAVRSVWYVRVLNSSFQDCAGDIVRKAAKRAH